MTKIRTPFLLLLSSLFLIATAAAAQNKPASKVEDAPPTVGAAPAIGAANINRSRSNIKQQISTAPVTSNDGTGPDEAAEANINRSRSNIKQQAPVAPVDSTPTDETRRDDERRRPSAQQ